MNNFTYHRAQQLQDASKMYSSSDNAKFLSGGMTLIPAMKHGLIQPDHLIDVTQITSLQGIENTEQFLSIGAATHHQDVASSEVVARAIPGLAYLASQIGDPQVRARGTLGGSIANNDPAADYPAGTLALKSLIVTNQREITAEKFFTGFYSTALAEDEVITQVKFCKPLKSAYAKFKQSASGYALAGVFIAVYPNQEVRVAVTGVGAGVFLWQEAAKSYLEGATQPPLQRDDLISDLHASANYRVNIAQVLFRQALEQIQ
jgi:carbon-monoxide dehydrogenase medium subunit